MKRVLLSEFDTSRRNTDATKLIDGDKVVFVGVIEDKQSVVLISKTQMREHKTIKRNSVGITGIKIDKGDSIATVV